MVASDLQGVLRDCAAAVTAALDELADWGPAGTRPGQYRSDLAADSAALDVLRDHGFGVLSEETGLVPDEADTGVIVIVDPVDGSTNASRAVPWFAVSLCAVVDGSPVAALVQNLATGECFEALAGHGAWWDGEPLGRRASLPSLGESIVGVSGLPPRHLGWRQFRALGASALDLCSVACGRLDAFVDCSFDAHGVWDYAGALLVCREVGIEVVDALGRELLVLDPAVRRTPVAAASAGVRDELVALRRTWR